MSALECPRCCGCLSTGRNLAKHIDTEVQRCLTQIIEEIAWDSSYNQSELRLCWECVARIQTFNRFKRQVQTTYPLLRDCSIPFDKTHSALVISQQCSFSLPIEVRENEDTLFEVVKLEEIIKKEHLIHETVFSDDIYAENEDDDDDDDKFLSEISERKKDEAKAKNGVKKKRNRKRTKDCASETDLYTVVMLTKEEIEEERRQLALLEEYVNAVYRCEKCIVTFPNSEDLADHISDKHMEAPTKVECPICRCWLNSESSLAYHRARHARRLRCARCPHRARAKREARSHYESAHGGKDLEYTANVENGHENKNANGKTDKPVPDQSFPCPSCAKVFRWKTSLRKHAETHRIEAGQKRRPYCEPCRLTFTTTANLQKHVRTSSKHQIQLKLRKLKASDPTLDPSSVAAAVTAVNDGRARFGCELCGARFQWRGNLLRHRDSHRARANGELFCAACDKSFSSLATYKQHMAVSKKHVSESDFKYMCSDCGKRFANRTRLREHTDWEHLKVSPFPCPLCPKAFRSRAALHLHRGTHQPRARLCDHCGRGFAVSPFPCPLCPKAFRSRAALHLHRGTHAPRARLCDHCGRGFATLGKLHSHILAAHSGAPPHGCPCGARFAWRSCLARHRRRAHRDPGPGDPGDPGHGGTGGGKGDPGYAGTEIGKDRGLMTVT